MYRGLCSLLIALALVWPQVGESATVNYNGGYAVGINNLVIGADRYNVIFEYGYYEDIFPSPPAVPFFWGDRDQAYIAVDAINSELNDENPIPDIIDGDFSQYFVPFLYSNLIGNYFVQSVEGKRSTESPFPYESGSVYGLWPNSDAGQERYWANIEAVPLPGTILLLCSGLAGLMGLKRKFKK
jgi:hypothetical protein